MNTKMKILLIFFVYLISQNFIYSMQVQQAQSFQEQVSNNKKEKEDINKVIEKHERFLENTEQDQKTKNEKMAILKTALKNKVKAKQKKKTKKKFLCPICFLDSCPFTITQ
ncbi:MAG: hypothetical protein P4L22_04825 [Candidatus Babeliales bacterium]|nr:hypothetical protein [Candidatus Babeliales bacterium]